MVAAEEAASLDSICRAPACDNMRSGREKACGAVEQEKGQERKYEKKKGRGGGLDMRVLI